MHCLWANFLFPRAGLLVFFRAGKTRGKCVLSVMSYCSSKDGALDFRGLTLLVFLLSGYSTAEVADLVGLKATQVRHYVRRDLLQPLRGVRGEFLFSFQDVVMLRSAKELLDAHIPPRRTNRILLGLKRRSTDSSRPLSALRLEIEGAGRQSQRVLLREDNVSWDVESGQGSLAFADGRVIAANDAEKVTPLGQPGLVSVRELDQLSSDDWYNLALDLEEVDPQRAPEAYRRALEENPRNTDAEVNLGRLYQLRGNQKLARKHYKAALLIAPDHPLANYNMGTIFDELDQFDTAVEFYLRAVSIPDAHYNLARLYEVRGNELASLRHMREYRRLIDSDHSER